MAAQYEKRVLTMNAWGQKQGYPPFCEVVTQEDGLANLQLIVDKVRGKEVPRVPAVSAFIEFCVGMMTGEVEKGGCRELRANTELYATALQSNRDLYERVVDRRQIKTEASVRWVKRNRSPPLRSLCRE